jgi:membrane fusion protein (multidrug efflux system)
MSKRVVGAIGLALILALCQSPLRAETVVAEGIVRSEARVEIKSKVVAPIKRIAVTEGQVARVGDLLVEMSNDVERSQVEAATAEVERARAALADAEQKKKTADRELERNLGVKDLITERDLELSQDAALQASTAFSMRQREFTKAEAHLALSTALYQSTFIRAPFTGQVTRIHTAVGAMPKPAETVLLDLVALDRLFVEIAIPLEHLKRVSAGMPVKLVIEEGHPANEVRIDGKITFIYPEIDPTIRMIRMKVGTDARGATIVPGMFAKATLELEDLSPAP